MALTERKALALHGKGIFGKVVNYAALPAPALHDGETWIALASQGIAWLPGSLGGTYYPKGQYYSDGTIWIYDSTPYEASQSTVNAGINTDQFVNSNTLANSVWAFTVSKVLATVLTGLNTALTGTITPFDTILTAFGKIQNSLNLKSPIDSPAFTTIAKAPISALYNATDEIATTKWVRDNAGGCLYRKSNGTPVTGVTTQQLVDEHLITGGEMEAGWDLLNEIYINKDLDNGTVTLRVLYNTTNSLSGATTLATYTSTVANNQASFIRNFGIISPTVTELFIPPLTNAAGDFIGTSNVTVTQLNIDWTQPYYILWSIQNSSVLDTSVISRNKLWKK